MYIALPEAERSVVRSIDYGEITDKRFGKIWTDVTKEEKFNANPANQNGTIYYSNCLRRSTREDIKSIAKELLEELSQEKNK